jgi:hypothetical protein
MPEKTFHYVYTAVAFCLLAMAGCTSPDEPITAIVVDTYNPTGPIGFSTINWQMDLFDANGDLAAAPDYDVWSTDITSDPAVLAWSDGSNNLDPEHGLYPHISYTAGIERGVPYYVRVRAALSGDFGAYAIRLLGVEPNPSVPRDLSWYFGGENLGDPAGLPLEGGNGIPTTFQELTLNGKLNCYINAGEVDWFRFVLP